MTKKRDVVRFQVELSRSHMEEVEELMRAASITTKKDLFNNAVAILKWAIREKSHGSTIIAVNERSDLGNRELWMPFLEGVMQNQEAGEGAVAPRPASVPAHSPASSRVIKVAIETGDATRHGDDHASKTQVERKATLALTPFERWLKEQKSSGAAASENASPTWRDFVAQSRQTAKQGNRAQDDISSNKE